MWMMRLVPCGVPTADGIVEWEHIHANFSLNVCATWLAIRGQMAVGMPRGQSFDLSLASLCRQKR